MKSILNLLPISLFALLAHSLAGQPGDYTQYVDPFIGTGGNGHTYPGAAYPFGMVQLSPDGNDQGWDWCGGYRYDGTSLMGFSHTHISGTGVPEQGDILLMPYTGKRQYEPGPPDKPGAGYRSRFSHEDEEASPGYYAVLLQDYGIHAELTVTPRCGMQRYTFPATDNAHIILDLNHGLGDNNVWCHARFLDDTTIIGYRQSVGWAMEQKVFFAMRLSKVPASHAYFTMGKEFAHEREYGYRDLALVLDYKTREDEQILIKTGISYVDMDGALANLEAEMPDWAFERYRQQARQAWREKISRIRIESDDVIEKRIFYTAMYHAHLAPSLFMDVDRRYRGNDMRIHKAEGYTRYTVFSLWDTFRSLNPLFTLLYPDMVRDHLRTMIEYSRESAYGTPPWWPLTANETWTMPGYHAAVVMAEAYAKGITGFDTEAALEALDNIATKFTVPQLGIQSYLRYGYVPMDGMHDSPSMTLEYAFDDWNIARLAELSGNQEMAERYNRRAENYLNVWNAKKDFFMARDKEGNWRSDAYFDTLGTYFYLGPDSTKSRDYTEANAYQYLWYVMHDVNELIDLMGGREDFIQRLDGLFGHPPIDREKHELATDMSGFVGAYAHGNEPCHHIAYLYNYAGQPWKTQKWVNHIMNTQYTDKPDGICGNEDCGQMSAWYIMSALGLYPVNPAGGMYMLSTPRFQKASLILPDGNYLTIEAYGADPRVSYYIQEAELQGKELNTPYVSHKDLVRGGLLRFVTGSRPNMEWGVVDEIPDGF